MSLRGFGSAGKTSSIDAGTVGANRQPGQIFLSTADRLSGITTVRDLNENVYQAAVSLAEEWGNWSHHRPLVGLESISLLNSASPSSPSGRDLAGTAFLFSTTFFLTFWAGAVVLRDVLQLILPTRLLQTQPVRSFFWCYFSVCSA